MKKIIYICCLLSIAWLRIEGQSLQVHGSTVELPPGGVLGAAFYEDKGMFVVQQYVPSTENGGLIARVHRQLSSWNLASHAMIMKRVIDETLDEFSHPCGRVQISTTVHQVYVCSAESHLEILDPDSLETVGTMAQVDGQTIIDFAVDDLHGRVLVLSARRDESILLTSYSLPKGEKLQETALPVINFVGSGGVPGDLVSLSQTGQIALSIEDKRGLKSKPGIYICKDDPDLNCNRITGIDQLKTASEISFLGQNLLVATSKFADNNLDCILSVDPDYKYTLKRPLTLAASNKYCSRTGVRYAVGVVENKYVVGFTGRGEYNPLTENWKTVSSSFSVWRAGMPRVAAVVKDPTGCATPFCGIRIAASKTNPLFITYQQTSNTLYLYSVEDH